MDRPVLLVAHGSRVDAAAAQAEAMRAAVEARRDGPVALCFIELAQPTPQEAVAALVADGAREVVVQPLLLLPGNHARFDVDAVAEVAREAGLAVQVGQPLGSDTRLLAVAEDHARALLPADAVLVIASGTASDAALRSLDTSAALVASGLGVGAVSAAPATLDGGDAVAAVTRLVADGRRRIVVLPWMLFPGRLEEATVAALRAAVDGVELVVADRFGVAPGVVEAVLRRIDRAR